MAGPETSSEVRRCPSCGVRNRGGGQWCTLCHADLTGRPLPTVAESLAELVGDNHPGEDGTVQDGTGEGDDRREPDDQPPEGPPQDQPLRPSGEVDPQLMQQLMLQLEAQESGIKLPRRLSGLSVLLRPGAPKGAAIGLAAGVMLALGLVILIVLTVVGLAL